jgi:hypothetical protein
MPAKSFQVLALLRCEKFFTLSPVDESSTQGLMVLRVSASFFSGGSGFVL